MTESQMWNYTLTKHLWIDFTEKLGVMEGNTIRHLWFETIITVPFPYKGSLISNNIFDIPIPKLSTYHHTIRGLSWRLQCQHLTCKYTQALIHTHTCTHTPPTQNVIYEKHVPDIINGACFWNWDLDDFNFFLYIFFILKLCINEQMLLLYSEKNILK